MTASRAGHELFIVDNSVEGWSGLRYLQEWTQIARAFDIATGYFEIGVLLSLDGKWQGLEKIRILMGSDMTGRTRKALLEGTRTRAEQALDRSLDETKGPNPFLDGVPAILDALRTGRIECRVYDREKFHAKAYITHAKLAVVGSQALVGSSNFTVPGLTRNIELNIQVQSAREVAQLQEWFETHWQAATDVTPAITATIERHTRAFTPFEVYAKALQEYFRGHELTASEWDQTASKMFPRLDRYQKEAYWALMKIAHKHGGAFLCDGVGLGKTFVGLMLIERLVRDNKRVVLFAPKAAREGVWDPHLREYLPHIGGGSDFSSLAVFNHTDLGCRSDFPERFRRLADTADVILIDEAHHFRNTGTAGDPATGRAPSRYHRLLQVLRKDARPKQVILLTATPINNRLSDFRHMIELFTQRDEAHFAHTLGINNLSAHFNQMEKALQRRLGRPDADLQDHMSEANQALSTDDMFEALVVQRSRAYARESQVREKGESSIFPVREKPTVAAYSVRKAYGRLLDMFEKAFTRSSPLFTLPMYYPLHWYKGPDKSIDPLDEGRQQQVVSLIRTQFLKRFESSVAAFESSCHRLLQRILAFVEVHSVEPSERSRLERWKGQHAELLGFSVGRQRELWGDDEEEADEDVVPPEMLEAVERLDRSLYKVDEMLSEAFLDLDQVAAFLDEARQFQPSHDDKLKKLLRLLASKELANQKVLLFTEFADTAHYLHRELARQGVQGVAQVDSTTKLNRADVIRRFAPYYNRTSSRELDDLGNPETRVLISTDVLSEGLNLQDASRVINYDIHWNPVRLMQRIGRVDRRMNPEVERRLLEDHPHLKASRGKVHVWNFLPPDELNVLLSLYTRVTQKTLLISRTLGIEGRRLLTPDDDYEALKEFNTRYEGERSALEDMHLAYQDMLRQDPALAQRLAALPAGVFSGRQKAAKGLLGVFFCYALPALDKESGEFTTDAGTTRWYFYDPARGAILDEPADIVASIRSTPETSRVCSMRPSDLVAARKKVEDHIKQSYLKRIDAPIGVKPALRCWMELNEGPAA